MKVTRSVRFSQETLRAIEWIQQREGGDVSDAVRRLLRKGLEREVADLYAQGKVTLREAAEVLSVSLLAAMDLLRHHGVPGNVTMEQALEAREVAAALSDA
jgi:predicted HTH domain antitoxin